MRRIWFLGDAVQLITCYYACEEAQRNLLNPEQLEGIKPIEQEQMEKLDRYMALIRHVTVVANAPDSDLPPGITLREKDRPILLAAIEVQATHLVTADFRDFGPYFGQTVGGVLIQPPAEFLRGR